MTKIELQTKQISNNFKKIKTINELQSRTIFLKVRAMKGKHLLFSLAGELKCQIN